MAKHTLKIVRCSMPHIFMHFLIEDFRWTDEELKRQNARTKLNIKGTALKQEISRTLNFRCFAIDIWNPRN